MVRIGKFIPKKLKKYIIAFKQKKYYIEINKRYDKILDELKNTVNEKRIILIGTSVFGNIGDQAISIAEMTFLKDTFPHQTIIEIPISLVKVIDIRPFVSQKDLLCLNGGGYMGDLWIEAQEVLDQMVEYFPNNRIVILPQTIYYHPGNKTLLEKHQVLYRKHNNISTFVRDEASYAFGKKYFNFKNLYLVPDIVSYLEKKSNKRTNKKVTLLFRNDLEGVNHSKKLDDILIFLSENNVNEVVKSDTVVKGVSDNHNRQDILNNFFDSISDSALVITDRLHGLILSAISGTPVVVFDNISKKTFGGYQWFKKLPYVFYFRDSDLEEQLLSLLNSEIDFNYDKSIFKEQHELLRKVLLAEFDEVK